MKNIVLNPILIDIEVSGEWEFIKPKRGDHIRVQRSGIYSHHGIYISDEEVIHFTGTDDDSILDWSKCEVICTLFHYHHYRAKQGKTEGCNKWLVDLNGTVYPG